MRNTEEDRGFYGYEDYKVSRIWSNMFHNINDNWVLPQYGVTSGCELTCIMFPVGPDELTPEGYLNIHIQEHPEILEKAKKIYTHPSCTLPRESIAKKYKRCINAIQADVVVIPKPSTDIWCTRTVVFVDEKKKLLLYYQFGNRWYGLSTEDIIAYNRILQFPKGTPLYEMVHPNRMDDFKRDYPSAKLAETGYYGEFTAKNKYLVDYMTYLLPKNKIVFQETLTNELNDETNKSSFETFMSIHDMLMSADKEIRNVGLKTLATMNYTDFKNSAICVLRHTVKNWKNDYKARNSTGVKYMMKILGITYPTERAMEYHGAYIRKEDFEILEKLWNEFSTTKREVRNLPFMCYDENYKLIPRLLPDDNQ